MTRASGIKATMFPILIAKTLSVSFRVSKCGSSPASTNCIVFCKVFVDDSKSVLIERYEQFKASNPKVTNLYKKFEVKEKKGWNILDGWNNLQKIENIENLIQPLSYRLFDDKYIIYEDKLVWRTTRQIGKHFINNKIVLSYEISVSDKRVNFATSQFFV